MDATSPAPHKRILKWILVGIAVLIVLTIFFGGYGGLNWIMGWFGKAPTEVSAPSGNLLVSAGVFSTTTGAFNGIHPVVVDVQTGIGSYLPADQLSAGLAMTLQYDISSDLHQATFLGALYDQVSSTSAAIGDALTVYSADLSGVSDYDTNLKALQSAKAISEPNDADYFREFPVIAPSRTILYSSLSKDSYTKVKDALASVPANNWNIVMVDGKGVARTVTQGLRPKWVDATHFAFLKSDGIYLYDLSANSEQRIGSATQTLTIVNGFDVSDDAQYMAFSDPVEGLVAIYHALSWNGNIVPMTDQFQIAATDLTFSPSDDYLAMLAHTGSDTSGKQTEIRYYSLIQHLFGGLSIPFNSNDIQGLYISDWKE